jgi:uncharacterized lipoprotein
MRISEAFAKYGATLNNVNWSVSAENEAGELILSLWQHYFKRPEGNTIKYVDRVSRWSGNGNAEFRKRIEKASKTNQVVRSVISKTDNKAAVDLGEDASQLNNTFHVREDWLGKVTLWDGDNFEITFVGKNA